MLSKFRASLLPIVIFNIWNVKKYGASEADPAKNVKSRIFRMTGQNVFLDCFRYGEVTEKPSNSTDVD